jgi:hypothetical protein
MPVTPDDRAEDLWSLFTQQVLDLTLVHVSPTAPVPGRFTRKKDNLF